MHTSKARPRHPETEVLHSGEGARPGATPLTTPIYATSTFVFENAAELEAYQQGRNDKYIYSRYANPSVQAVEQKRLSLRAVLPRRNHRLQLGAGQRAG